MVAQWHDIIGIVTVLILPKRDRGTRPIWLLPAVIILRMRIRCDVIGVSQRRQERQVDTDVTAFVRSIACSVHVPRAGKARDRGSAIVPPCHVVRHRHGRERDQDCG